MKKFVCAATITLGLMMSAVFPLRAQSALPAGWPARVELGMSDAPGGRRGHEGDGARLRSATSICPAA